MRIVIFLLVLLMLGCSEHVPVRAGFPQVPIEGYQKGTATTTRTRLLGNRCPVGDFGESVAIRGGQMVLVGEPYFTTPAGTFSGSVHVFMRENAMWYKLEGLLPTPRDLGAYAHFGSSVALSGENLAIVGAPGDHELGLDVGAVYVYSRNPRTDRWSLEQKLTPQGASANARFGTSVSTDGTTIVIGAHVDLVPGSAGAGAAFVFERVNNKWVQRAKLRAYDGTGGNFGSCVHVKENQIVIGSPNTKINDRLGAGAIYLYKKSDGFWDVNKKTPKIWSEKPVEGGYFGISVASTGSFSVVGAWMDVVKETPSGAAYVYDSEWKLITKLTPETPARFDLFGNSVAISDNLIAVGSPQDDGLVENAGAVYLFKWDGSKWVPADKLYPATSGLNSHFGYSVSVVLDYVVTGAIWDSEFGERSGAAYVFDFVKNSNPR